MPSTHAQRLERWLGAEQVAHISEAMKDWYGPPIAIGNTPGAVRVIKGGDFVGPIKGGGFANLMDFQLGKLKGNKLLRALDRAAQKQHGKLHTGFSSLSDLISEATAGKRREFQFQKAGATGVVNSTNTLWYVGAQPAAGAAAGAAPGGTVPDSTTTGGFPYDNPTGGDTMHYVSGFPVASVAPNTLLLYDRLFSVTKTMSSSATEAVTGVPTRYTNTVAGSADSIAGNFLMIECRSALGATAHNWTTCLYTNQAGSTGVTLPSVTGNASCIANRLDIPAGSWFCPLATGDTGIKALTQMQCSTASLAGGIDFTIGHPLAWMPCPIANLVCTSDGINSAFNLVRIFDSACMTFLEVNKSATTATNYAGSFTTVRG